MLNTILQFYVTRKSKKPWMYCEDCNKVMHSKKFMKTITLLVFLISSIGLSIYTKSLWGIVLFAGLIFVQSLISKPKCSACMSGNIRYATEEEIDNMAKQAEKDIKEFEENERMSNKNTTVETSRNDGAYEETNTITTYHAMSDALLVSNMANNIYDNNGSDACNCSDSCDTSDSGSDFGGNDTGSCDCGCDCGNND